MIKAQDILYNEFDIPDLDKEEAFLTDFGMIRAERSDETLYMRGRGKFPYLFVGHKADKPGFRAVAFAAEKADDLETLAKHPDAKGNIEDVPGPGGGQRIKLNGPDNFEFQVVHGFRETDEMPVRDPLKINFAKEKQRVGTFQRPELGPSEVIRLGHSVLKVTDADDAAKWLSDTLGMLPSDILHVPDDENVNLGLFMRLNKGDRPADHHVMLVLTAPDDIKHHHTSYETQDPDAVFIGGHAMEKGGWQREWGIGRHVLGSQVFDYWRDPWGHMFEHYADGDLVTEEHQPGRYPATPENLSQWGPEVSETFFN